MSVDLLHELVAKGYLYSHREFDYCPDRRIRARINFRCDGNPKINLLRWIRHKRYFMKTHLLVTPIAILLSSCISPYDYEDCGVLYDKPTANPLGTSGDIFADTWGDLVMASRNANQRDFFENNACRLSVKKTQRLE